jgi:acetolactate synthase-1/2/3 large subunit
MSAKKMSGARFMAETFKGYGVTHVFFVEAILRRTLVEMEALGIRRILTHSEKAAAYMADGYARMSRRPGICMSQSVGAANLASGLQDPYLGLSPVIALTGKKPPFAQHRNAYQEIPHGPMFESVTKYNVSIDTGEQLPYFLRQAFREATSGSPGPVHLDIGGGYAGEGIESAEVNSDVVIEEPFTHYPSMRPEPGNGAVQGAVRVLEDAERPVIVAV